ncbi:hypothetical protein [Arsenicicoccus dermatophilus]|uniref:hypothetical protein n=1 Tax=Arsenicicoccus dermatophilus TaxID=1076331 RepID=UPI001F4C8AD4|nr:hypothetical protein [Arsenicicoccus dermatophilus]MCH8614455.1 hypothetical protein [Arsenicicoccus dermatophilus]
MSATRHPRPRCPVCSAPVPVPAVPRAPVPCAACLLAHQRDLARAQRAAWAADPAARAARLRDLTDQGLSPAAAGRAVGLSSTQARAILHGRAR